MTKIHFKIPKFKYLFDNRILTRGNRIYQAGDIYDAYAIDEYHACCKVKGTIDYTVLISIEDGYLNAECNCPYMGHCKHEVAALLYIQHHPELEVINKTPDLNTSILEDYKLYLSELEYDLDHEDDEFVIDLDYQSEAIDYIDDCECSVATKIDMLALYNKYFSFNQDAWNLLSRLYVEDRNATIKQMIKNVKDFFFVQSIAIAIDYIIDEDLHIYGDIVKQLIKALSKSKYEELECFMLKRYEDNETIKTLFNNQKNKGI